MNKKCFVLKAWQMYNGKNKETKKIIVSALFCSFHCSNNGFKMLAFKDGLNHPITATIQ